MTSSLFFIVLLFAVICTGLVSGIFLAFSDFVMRSLKRANTNAGVEVMQLINRQVYKSMFIYLLWGMVGVSILLAGYAYFSISGLTFTLILAGASLNVFGIMIVSFAFNIPMNERLDTLEYSGAEAANYWKDKYMPRWVFWNHIRTITTGAAAVCFLFACILLSQGAVTA